MQSFQTLGQLFKIPTFVRPKIRQQGGKGGPLMPSFGTLGQQNNTLFHPKSGRGSIFREKFKSHWTWTKSEQ
jgi:hypothetical protein